MPVRRARVTVIAQPLAALLVGSVLAQEATPPSGAPTTPPSDDGFVIIWEGEIDDGFVVIGEDRSSDTGFMPPIGTPVDATPVTPFEPIPRTGTPAPPARR